MTIFDMLDKLEAEILSLRSASSRRKSPPVRKENPGPELKRKQVRRVIRNAKHSQIETPAAAELFDEVPASVDAQMSLPVSDGALPAEAARVLGKRQALGRSLTQLRKAALHRREIEQSSS